MTKPLPPDHPWAVLTRKHVSKEMLARLTRHEMRPTALTLWNWRGGQ